MTEGRFLYEPSWMGKYDSETLRTQLAFFLLLMFYEGFSHVFWKVVSFGLCGGF